MKPETEATLEVIRDGKPVTVKLSIGTMPEEVAEQKERRSENGKRMGHNGSKRYSRVGPEIQSR